MTVTKRKPTLEEQQFLTDLVKLTRTNPEQFRSGREYIEENFSFAVIQANRQAVLEEQREQVLAEYERVGQQARAELTQLRARVRGQQTSPQMEQHISRLQDLTDLPLEKHPYMVEHMKDVAAWPLKFAQKHAAVTIPRDAMLKWMHELDWQMSRAKAEAACLVAVRFYDLNPKPHPAFGPTLQSIPSGYPDTGASDPDLIQGMWWFNEMHGFDAHCVEVARVAHARIESFSPVDPPVGGKEVRVTSTADDRVTVSGWAAGFGPVSVEIRGEALCTLFKCVLEITLVRGSEKDLEWETVRERFIATREYGGHLVKVASIKDYARRIRTTLDSRGLGHLWIVDAKRGVRWIGDCRIRQ